VRAASTNGPNRNVTLPGLLHQQGEVVYPIAHADASRVDYMRAVAGAVGHDEIRVRDRIAAGSGLLPGGRWNAGRRLHRRQRRLAPRETQEARVEMVEPPPQHRGRVARRISRDEYELDVIGDVRR